MNKLSSGCWYSDFNVFPANWNTARASLKKTWRIEYWFHDPSHSGKYKRGYPKVIKTGINKIKVLSDRQREVRQLIEQEKQMLVEQGYNPIQEKLREKEITIESPVENLNPQIAPDKLDYVLPSTPFAEALRFALDQKQFEELWKKEVTGFLERFITAAGKLIHPVHKLPLDQIPIAEVRGRHVELILKQQSRDWSEYKILLLYDKKKAGRKISRNDTLNLEGFTNNTFNRYRKNLWNLFEILIKQEAILGNPAKTIDKRPEIKSAASVLTIQDRKKIDKHLKEINYVFWRLLHMFFHGGCHETEFVSIRLCDVEFHRGRFKIFTKKGRAYRWVWKPINHQVRHLWAEMIAEAQLLPPDNTGDPIYLFWRGLKPAYASKPIGAAYIGRRWKLWVKEKLGIKEDFRVLRHLKSTETIDELSARLPIELAEQVAAQQNGHTSTDMVQEVYDVKSAERRLERMRRLNRPFA